LVLIAVWGSSRGYPALDGIGGMLVGGYLIWSGFSIAKEVINPLIGEPPSRELVTKIRKLCRDRENINNANDITVHKYGHHQFIGLHAEVSSALSVQVAHDIAEELAEYLQEELGAYTTVHIDPIDRDNPLVHQVGDRLNELIKTSENFRGFQDLRVVETPQHKVILFEMEVAPDADLKQQTATITWLTKALMERFPNSEIDIQISPLHTYR